MARTLAAIAAAVLLTACHHPSGTAVPTPSPAPAPVAPDH